MYGWIVDGISSLFEPVTTGKKPTEWSGKGNVSEEASTRPGVKVRSLQQENHARPAKRHYQRSVLSIIVKYICSRCGSDLYLTVTVSTLTCPCLLRPISCSLATQTASITKKKLLFITRWNEQKKHTRIDKTRYTWIIMTWCNNHFLKFPSVVSCQCPCRRWCM